MSILSDEIYIELNKLGATHYSNPVKQVTRAVHFFKGGTPEAIDDKGNNLHREVGLFNYDLQMDGVPLSGFAEMNRLNGINNTNLELINYPEFIIHLRSKEVLKEHILKKNYQTKAYDDLTL